AAAVPPRRGGRRDGARGPQGGRGVHVTLGTDDQGGGDVQGGGEYGQLRAESERSLVRGGGDHAERGSAAYAVPVPVPVSLPWIEPGHAKVLQGLTQMPGTHGVRLVVVEKLDPAGRIGRMVDGQRGQDGHADGIRYLVALA